MEMDWRPTKDTIHLFSRILGKIRQALTPPQRHWGHISLVTHARGLTTTTIPANKDLSLPGFEIQLDFCNHHWVFLTGAGEKISRPMQGWTSAGLWRELLDELSRRGIETGLDLSLFSENKLLEYDPEAAQSFWGYLSRIDLIFKEFRGGLRESCSAVQLWPHHFDLSFSWYSGRRVPGQDPRDEEKSDEQMTFGLSTGDAGIPEAYFYGTSYPIPQGWMDQGLPVPAVWHQQGWKGALLMFKDWRNQKNSRDGLLKFLQAVHSTGKKLMQ